MTPYNFRPSKTRYLLCHSRSSLIIALIIVLVNGKLDTKKKKFNNSCSSSTLILDEIVDFSDLIIFELKFIKFSFLPFCSMVVDSIHVIVEFIDCCEKHIRDG